MRARSGALFRERVRLLLDNSESGALHDLVVADILVEDAPSLMRRHSPTSRVSVFPAPAVATRLVEEPFVLSLKDMPDLLPGERAVTLRPAGFGQL